MVSSCHPHSHVGLYPFLFIFHAPYKYTLTRTKHPPTHSTELYLGTLHLIIKKIPFFLDWIKFHLRIWDWPVLHIGDMSFQHGNQKTSFGLIDYACVNLVLKFWELLFVLYILFFFRGRGIVFLRKIKFHM